MTEKNFITCLDLREQPKKFLEGDWDIIISKHVQICREAGVHQLLIFIADNNKEDFERLLNKLGEKSQFLGDSSKVMPSLSLIPANGKAYALNF